MSWIDREETVRNVLAARREQRRRLTALKDAKAAYVAARKAAKLAAERTEVALQSLEAKQGFLPFSAPAEEPTTAGR